MRHYSLILLLFVGISPAKCQLPTVKHQLTIMSYNVENFFNPAVDSLNRDLEYTPKGSHRWSYARFNRKAEQIARVIASVVTNSCPDIVALNEVEDATCMALLCRKLPNYPYRFIHFDSPDHRGIDVALLYDSTRCHLLSAQPIHVSLAGTHTRDILYSVFVIAPQDTLHIFACHLPSQWGGYTNSQWKRDSVKAVLRQQADSILTAAPNAQIIVCGDMNMPPKNDLAPLTNCMHTNIGTHKFRGIWTCLDQFYISPSLTSCTTVRVFDAPWLMEEDLRYLSSRPKRTFTGFRYSREGFSDHLPIILTKD